MSVFTWTLNSNPCHANSYKITTKLGQEEVNIRARGSHSNKQKKKLKHINMQQLDVMIDMLGFKNL